jgi:hypothetical protein
MRMVDNADQYTKKYIKKRWASLGFEIYDEYDSGIESKGTFGEESQFKYQKSKSFYGLGGFVEQIDILQLEQDDAVAKVEALTEAGFIDEQTRLIVIDFVVYNSYTGFFNNVIMIAQFEANGLITTKLEMYNMKKDYYGDSAGDGFRIFCESCFLLLLIYYLIIETIEIKQDILNQRKDYEKKVKRK